MTLSNLCWALEQHCDSPLEKLLLIHFADTFGMDRSCSLDRQELATFCCTTDLAVMEAIRSLDLSGLVRFISFSAHDIEIELLAPHEFSEGYS